MFDHRFADTMRSNVLNAWATLLKIISENKISIFVFSLYVQYVEKSRGVRRLFSRGSEGGGGGNFGMMVKKNIPLLHFLTHIIVANLIKNLKPKFKDIPLFSINLTKVSFGK